MAKPDVAVKNWLSNKKRFADFFNGIIFNGEQVVSPEDLTPMDSETDFIVKDKSDKRKDKSVQRYRDIIMNWKSDITLMILACEIQDKINYAMPVRNMLYDSLSYVEQMKEIWNNLSDEEKKNLSTEEFFSRFRKEDKLRPVITLVFYYGTNVWDGNNDIYDMFKLSSDKITTILMKYVTNYKINVIEPINIKDISTFKTDLQMIMGMLRCRHDKVKLIEYVNSNEEYFGAVDVETAYAIGAMVKSKRIMKIIENEKEEVCDMCKALDDLYKDGVAEGKVEGRQEGKQEGKQEGRLETNKENILDLLSDYGSVSQHLNEKINSQEEVEILKKWVKLSARVNSIEEFEDMMDRV